MKIKKDLIKREFAGESVLVPVGKTVYDSKGLFVLNERIIVVVTVEGKVHILTDEKQDDVYKIIVIYLIILYIWKGYF